MGTGFSAAEEDLFFQTGEALCRRLREAGQSAESLGAIREALSGFDRAYAGASLTARRSVVCSAGCGTCCHEQVGVQAHEVLIAAEYVQARFSPEALAAVIARAAEHRAAFVARGHRTAGAAPRPCVLLREGSCSIYEARPESCRAHHSRSLAGCQKNLAAGSPVVDVHIHGTTAHGLVHDLRSLSLIHRLLCSRLLSDDGRHLLQGLRLLRQHQLSRLW